MSSFSDPAMISDYADSAAQKVPGLADLHRMMTILLQEKVGAGGQVLVLGAGGGMELLALAKARPDWTLTGVDPSEAMLDLARQTLGPDRPATLTLGTIDDAPAGPFDGATCLLTLHFLTREERAATLGALKQRLKPGAPLVVAHHSFPQDDASKALWLNRYAAFSTAPGGDLAKTQAGAQKIGELLPVLSPDDDEKLLREAGFTDVSLFYAGFTFRGWVGTAT
ncbi:class I SAM-dependent methyltransferase [Flavimaricola marinus]|uniref:tRNA (Cmo5U34)-methyltransferase n=1 Tax=Flavimaricola marinus TaxID=1819565 RepID=A0A238LIC5_9RHOB|nr:class I SAM-dependent methyltransferase [Flavimaricola marinus]SMY08630.1 tRNA (cmo5U34)-methyltransferase [Flavimaricola marinus]